MGLYRPKAVLDLDKPFYRNLQPGKPMLRILLILPVLVLAFGSGALAQNVGTYFCRAIHNSTGVPTFLSGRKVSGVGSELHLEATDGVPGEFGYLLVGSEATSGVVVGNGRLCLVGTGTATLHRYNVAGGSYFSVGQFDTAGVLQNTGGT